MLVIGETCNEHKAELLDQIRVSRKLVATVNAQIKKYPNLRDDCLEVIGLENEVIGILMAELVDLERWRVANGYEKDDKYHPRGANYEQE